jgi:hypothetical protein
VRLGIYTAEDGSGGNTANQIPEESLFLGSRFIASNATMVIGSLLSIKNFSPNKTVQPHRPLLDGVPSQRNDANHHRTTPH